MKEYIKEFYDVFFNCLVIIEGIEEHAKSISNELKECKTNEMVMIGEYIINNNLVHIFLKPSGLETKSGVTASAYFQYSPNSKKFMPKIIMCDVYPDSQYLKNVSQDFNFMSALAHETIHAYQKFKWNTLKSKYQRLNEVEAAIFEIPVALAIYLVRGGKLSKNAYDEFMHRLLYVQTSRPYYRMKEVRIALEDNKEFIWEYAKSLEKKFSDYCPVRHVHIGDEE